MKEANGELKIEKGIPIPSDGQRGPSKGALANALLALKKGDSVLTSKSYPNVMQHCMRYLGKGNYTIRAVDGGGIRVWRIK